LRTELVPYPELTLDGCFVVLSQLENGKSKYVYCALMLLGDIFELVHRKAPLELVQRVVAVAQQHNTQGASNEKLLGDRDAELALPVSIVNHPPGEGHCEDDASDIHTPTASSLEALRLAMPMREATLYKRALPEPFRDAARRMGVDLGTTFGEYCVMWGIYERPSSP
jgi:hypothetical protein